MKNLFMALIVMLLASPIFAQTGNIVLTINGIENTKGNIVVGIYNSKSTFPIYGKQTQGANLKPTKSGTVTYTFKNLPDGTYAVAVWHDENENKIMDTNLFGAPKEKYGFSKNIYGTFGPPDFEEVSFKIVDGKSVELAINLE